MGAIVAVIGEGEGAGVTHTRHLVTTPDAHSETPPSLFLFVQVMLVAEVFTQWFSVIIIVR